jgi:hypothetical protein
MVQPDIGGLQSSRCLRQLFKVYPVNPRTDCVTAGCLGTIFIGVAEGRGATRSSSGIARNSRGRVCCCKSEPRMKRKRAQVGAWTLVYGQRMDSRYGVTVPALEAVVEFLSFRAGWTSSWSSSWIAAAVAGGSTSVGPTTGARATAARTAASLSKQPYGDERMPGTSGATRGGRTMQRISRHRGYGSTRKPKR